MRRGSIRLSPRQAAALAALAPEGTVAGGLRLVAAGQPYELDLDAAPARARSGGAPVEAWAAAARLRADARWQVLALLDRADRLQARAIACRATAERARALLLQGALGGAP